MYKHLLITTITLLSLSPSFATSEDQIANLFNQYSAQQKIFFAEKFTRSNVAEKTTAFLKVASQAYEQIYAVEKKGKFTPSEDGNQLRYEIELLEPLVNFSKSAMAKNDCQQNLESAERNIGNTEDPDYIPDPAAVAIQDILEKLCK